MRLIKMFGLAAVAAVAAMAFVGATSASATSTALCNTNAHEDPAGGDEGELVCPEGQLSTTVSMNNTGQGVGLLLSSLVTVLCLTLSGSANVLALGNPQAVHITSLSFTNCGTKAAHNNCQVTTLGDLPLANLLKTGLDTGTITGTDGETLVNCDNIDIFGIDIHCVYDAAGLTFAVGAQHLTAFETKVDKISGSLCPSQSALDGLLKTTANRYVLA